MASIGTYVEDSQLRFRRIYDTKKVTMNEYTRRALDRRVGCVDNMGIKCLGPIISSCENAYSGEKCTTLDAFTDENDVVITAPGIVDDFATSFRVIIDTLDLDANGKISREELDRGNVLFNLNLTPAQLDIYYQYFSEWAYSSEISQPPVFVDKFYTRYQPEEDYDIASGDIKTMTATQYYINVASEQSRTTTSTINSGIKGPIEFILMSKADPKKVTFVYTANNWRSITTFVDKQQEGEHVYVSLKLHEADYRSGKVTVQAYAIEQGKRVSAITTQVFNVKNYNKITIRPDRGTTIPYYIEYLSNWFDIDPKTGNLIDPVSYFYQISDPYLDMELTPRDKQILTTYLRHVQSFCYSGPTSMNRNKLNTGYGNSIATPYKGKSFTYGNASINKLMNGVTLDYFLGTDIYDGNWLASTIGRPVAAGIDGLEEYRPSETFTPDRISFRMNGGEFQMKTSGTYQIFSAWFRVSVSPIALLQHYQSTRLTLATDLPGASIGINPEGMNTPYGSLEIIFGANYAQYPTWTTILNVGQAMQFTSSFQIKSILKTNSTVYDDGHSKVIRANLDIDNYELTNDDVQCVVWIPSSIHTGEWKVIPTIELFNNNEYLHSIGAPIYIEESSWAQEGYIVNDMAVKKIMYERVCFFRPGNKVEVTMNSAAGPIASYGLRGVALSNYSTMRGAYLSAEQLNDPQYPFGSSDWGGRNSNGFQELNPTNPQGFQMFNKGTIFTLPGIDTATDLIGWKIRQEIMDKETMQTKRIVDYTITHTFYETEIIDKMHTYFGFASFKYNNQQTEVTIINKDAGIYTLNPIEKGLIRTLLVCPDNYKNYDTTIQPLGIENYHPDSRSLILNPSATDYRRTALKIISDEYKLNPNHHNLLKDKYESITSGMFFGTN